MTIEELFDNGISLGGQYVRVQTFKNDRWYVLYESAFSQMFAPEDDYDNQPGWFANADIAWIWAESPDVTVIEIDFEED